MFPDHRRRRHHHRRRRHYHDRRRHHRHSIDFREIAKELSQHLPGCLAFSCIFALGHSLTPMVISIVHSLCNSFVEQNCW